MGPDPNLNGSFITSIYLYGGRDCRSSTTDSKSVAIMLVVILDRRITQTSDDEEIQRTKNTQTPAVT